MTPEVMALPDALSQPERRQSGYVVAVLAFVGIIVASLYAMPVVQRSVSALARHEAVEPSTGLLSAVEHAIWRTRYDPAFVDGMAGTPPTAGYALETELGTATITVTAAAALPDDEGVVVALTVTPSLVPPDVTTEVTYTLTVSNHDNVAHEITEVYADPRVFLPQFVAGSTSGFEDADPVYQAGEWRWTVSPAATVPAWGGQTVVSWRVQVTEGPGNYWTQTAVRVSGVGVVPAPMPGAVRVASLGDIDIVASVDRPMVMAGSLATFEYTVTVTNLSDIEDYTPRWIKHYLSRDFDYVDGSTSGASTQDPHRNHDVINDRWEFTWNLQPHSLGPGESATLRARFSASLPSAVHFAASAVEVMEDPGANGQVSTAATGDTAPVTALSAFDIHVTLAGGTADARAVMRADRVDLVSWSLR